MSKSTSKVVKGIAFIGMAVMSSNIAADTVDDLSASLDDKINFHSNGVGVAAFTLPRSDDFKNIPQDPENPLTRDKVKLGKLLYHETAVGTEGTDPERTETWGCASCHHVAAGFKAGIPQGIADGGVGFGLVGENRRLMAGMDATAPAGDPKLPDIQPVTSPTTLNTAYQDVMLWNGSFGNSEGSVNNGFAKTPTAGPPEIKANTFGLSGLETQVLAGTRVHRLRFDNDSILQSNFEYRFLYNRVFPWGNTGFIPENETEVTAAALGAAKAIAAYERTILSNLAPFQRWLGGDRTAMTASQLRGANLFFGKADCVACHTGPALSSPVGATADQIFFAIGFADFDTSLERVHGSVDEATSKGRGGFTDNPNDDYKFKIPPLYNLKDTNVFGHGASFTSVRQVVEYKNRGVPQNAASIDNLSHKFRPLDLSSAEIDDLVTFLEDALYDAELDRYVPDEIPSGNCFPVADLEAAMDLGCITDEPPYDNDKPSSDYLFCQSAASDPDGDGWGWEDHRSCKVNTSADGGDAKDPSEPVSSGHPVCQLAGSDPDGDGWGWEDNQSCKVSSDANQGGSDTPSVPVSSGHPNCALANSDPDGDGWGWENHQSCIVAN